MRDKQRGSLFQYRPGILVFSGVLLIIFSGMISKPVFFPETTAYAMALNSNHHAQHLSSCLVAAPPGSQSLLVVLLDRSGSLTAEPGATDPSGYSTSVTRALADLWPGSMAVIPFSGDHIPLPVLGPDTLSDLTQRADLRQKIEDYPIGGDTPLAPAMQQALGLLQQAGNPAGSRVIVITDGNPTGQGNNDGPSQEKLIRSQLIAQYCQRGIPVDAFGLTINIHSSDGQDANSLLSAIAAGTGASYTNVTSPQDLANQVIRLYAQWQELTFTKVAAQGSNYPVSIDSFAQQVSIVTFRSAGNYAISLSGPDGQPVSTGITRASDPHYEIDSLVVSGPIIAGTYNVNVGGDPDAQVYALVKSPLQVQLLAPSSKTVAYANQPVLIQAQFLNGNEILTPQANQGQIVARVTLLVNGRAAGPATNDIVLTQQTNSPLFSGKSLVYQQPGQLQIELQGTYQHVLRSTTFTLTLLKPLPPPKPPAPPCNIKCLQQKYGATVAGILAILVLLALITVFILGMRRRRQNQPKPYGYMTNGKLGGEVELDRFRKPVISSRELENKGLILGDAKFELVFAKDGKVRIHTLPGNSSIVAIDVPGQVKPKNVDGQLIEISPGRKISINGKKAASFEVMAGKRWS